MKARMKGRVPKHIAEFVVGYERNSKIIKVIEV